MSQDKYNDSPGEIHLVLKGVTSLKVKELLQRLEVEENTDVVTAGLRLLEWYLDRRAQGYEHQLVKDGRVYSVNIVNLID